MSPHTDPGALLPCPFCGKHAAMTHGQYYAVECSNSGHCHARTRHFTFEPDAIKAWNARQAASHGSTGNVVGWMARCSTTGGRLFAHTELTASLEGKLIYSEHGFTVEPLVVAASQGRAGGERSEVRSAAQISELDDASNACLELASKHGYATGHGDTVADMIREFSAQIPAAAQAQTGCGDPVAYRWRWQGGVSHNPWRLVESANALSSYTTEVEPLYASPPVAQGVKEPSELRQHEETFYRLVRSLLTDVAIAKLGVTSGRANDLLHKLKHLQELRASSIPSAQSKDAAQ